MGFKPPAGSAGSSVNPQAGIWVPNGSLDRWKAKRALHAIQLVEVVCFGDSTTFGQTATGNNTNSANNYSFVQKMRALALAAGYTDGGIGARGFYDNAALSGADNLAHIASNTGWVQSPDAFLSPLLNYATSSGTSSVVGNAITLQGKGRYARVFYGQVASGTGTAVVSYSTDTGLNGSLSGVSGSATKNRIQCLVLDFGTSGTHTVTLTVTTVGRMDVVVDWINATGLAFHKHGVPSVQLGGMFGGASSGYTYYMGPAVGLGVGQDMNGASPLNVAYGQSVTGPRVPALAICNLGINDVGNSTTQANAINQEQAAEAAIGQFAKLCETAGVDGLVCIPHLHFATNGDKYAGNIRSAILAGSIAYNLPVIDIGRALGTYANGIANYAANLAAPHLNAAGYDAQATALWNFISTV